MEYDSIYSKVPLSKSAKEHEIRLLVLEGGAFDDELVVNLRVAVLAPKNKPQYEALSYAWGSDEQPSQLTAIANEKAQPLSVTQNLDSALRHLRYTDRSRVLWVDAVCINQEDVHERSSQVANMAAIYELAERVVIWLGPEADDSGLAMDTLWALGTRVVVVDWNSLSIAPAKFLGPDEMHWGSEAHALPYQDNELRAVRRLVRRPWFGRLWVLQEARRANDEAIVVCGYSIVQWQTFLVAMLCFVLKPTRTPTRTLDEAQGQALIKSFFAMHSPTLGESLPYVFSAASFRKCSDERDRIYAVAHLPGKSLSDLGVVVDYTRPVEVVYQDFVLKYLEHTGDLDIITTLSGSMRDPASRSGSQPSWVPSFSYPAERSLMRRSLAGGYLMPDWSYLGNGILRVKGVHCATVDEVRPLLMTSDKWQSVMARVRAIMPENVHDGIYITGCTVMEAFAATLVSYDGVEYDRPAKEDWPARQMEYLLAEALRPSPKGEDVTHYLRQVHSNSGGRAFVTTREGYMASAPQHTQPGDIICAFVGLSSCVVVRRSGNDNRYRIVGECFVYGLCNGEAIHGRMPFGYTKLYKYDAAINAHRRMFVHNRTGAISSMDPRIQEALWSSPWKMFRTLARQALKRDVAKREELLKRGIQLQDFMLV